MRAMDVMTTNVITVSPDTTGYSDRPKSFRAARARNRSFSRATGYAS
jgi:hypothetical protein